MEILTPASFRLLWLVPLVAAGLIGSGARACADGGARGPLTPGPSPAGGEGRRFDGNKEIEKLLEPVREKHKVPGLVAGIVDDTGLTIAGAVGIRKSGSPEPMTVNDKLHLGSDTKAITAMLLATLVEESMLT